MTGESGTSRRYVEQQYGDDRNLAARQSIYRYQRPQLDLYNSSLDLAGLRGDESVLDIGCGNGRYLATLRSREHRGLACGGDMSEGMLRSAREVFDDGPLLVCDAQSLPFGSDAFDVVLSMHMLYHVPDRARALAEMRRVLRSDGVALVLTNSDAHFRGLDELLDECAATVGATQIRSRASLTRFKAEAAEPELSAVFAEVTAHPFRAELVIDDVDPVVAYARSMGAFVVDGDDEEREAILRELARRLAAIIATDGAFRVTTACVCFVCR